MTNSQDRRDFLKTTGAAAVTAGLFATGAYAAGSDEIKVGIIGCGGRGSGAGTDVLQAAKNVTIHALGDAFEESAKGARRRLENFAKGDEVKEMGNKVDCADRVFHGLDAYKKVIDSGANYIILATPPGFRPTHIQAAIAAGKHVFTEKPVAVDGPGYRKVIEAYEEANKKKLGVAAGTQRRHQNGYIETIKRIHQGEIGEIMGGRCAWNQGILWSRARRKDMTDMQYQVHNWYNFTWLCGDHIVEQHVHNIDVTNWALRAVPVRANGMGFRTRTNPEYGHIYDFFAVDYEYPNGVHVISNCRQISSCANEIAEFVRGTKGTSQINAYQINGAPVFNRRMDNRPYVQEHTDLIASIRKNDPINELKTVADSTLTAIMGRMSAYTGRTISWEMARDSKEDLMPANLAWDAPAPQVQVAIPGKTKFS